MFAAAAREFATRLVESAIDSASSLTGRFMPHNEESGESLFLDGLPPAARDRFLALAGQTAFPPGVVFREGDQHERLHVIESGIVQLSMHVPGRGSVPILTVGPGELLAWSAVLGVHGPVMTATAVAMEATITRSIGFPEFEQICRSEPAVGLAIWRQISRSLSRRLVATRLQLLDLFAEPVTSPTASSLSSDPEEAVDSTNSDAGRHDAQ
jgi:CRP-like cAMP-binding protein